MVEILASLVPGSLGENVEGIKPRGVIHWVSATKGVEAEVRLYDRLFNHPNPDGGDEDFMAHINPDSYKVISVMMEPSLVNAKPEQSFQFEREGYFVADRHDHTAERPVFNKTIGLRDVWGAKQ